MAYCDYCECSDCKNGTEKMRHCETDEGKWICTTCFTYDMCLDRGHDPDDCLKHHGPYLVGDWI